MADSFQPRFVDLVRNYTATQGIENFELGSAVPGYRGFESEIEPGERFYYSAIGIDKPTEFEVGRGTMEADGTISRDPITGPPTIFTGGNKTIALVAAAEWYEGVQAGSAGSFAPAPSRAALAALTDTSKAAVLLEPGREGLFVFDPTDLAGQIIYDPSQAIFVAPESDPTGASGAWTRRYSGPLEASWFGAVGDGAANNTAAFQAAINYFERFGGGGELRLGGGTFKVVGTLLMWLPGLTLDARGATVISSDASAEPLVWIGGDKIHIRGGIWKLTGGHDNVRAFDVEGRDCEIDDARLVKEPEAGGYQAYIRHSADGFVIRHCRSEGSNGIYCEASNSALLMNRFKGRAVGGDDAIAIKGIQGFTRGIRIIGNEFENLAYLCSIGSEIGVLGANDPTYSRGVGNVVIADNIGLACTGIAYIKPGAISQYDYRDGTVENVIISNNELRDPTGLKFSRGIAITPGRGARVRHVTGSNNLIVARSKNTTGRRVGAIDCYISTTDVGTAPADISDIDLGVTFVDPYAGAAAGGSAPGLPVSNVAAFEVVNAGTGTMGNIRVALDGNGCASSGVFVDDNVPNDAVELSRVRLANINAADTSAAAGVRAKTRLVISDPAPKIEMAFGPAYRLETNGEIAARTSNAFFCEQIAAGNTGSRRPWAAPVRCYVTKVELLTDVYIARSADDSNYTQFELRNTGGIGDPFCTVKSSATGGRDFPVNTFNTLMLAREITGVQQADCFFAKDAILQLAKRDVGTGNTVRNAHIRVHWAPY